MAKVSMALAELVEKGAKDDVVRELLEQEAYTQGISTRSVDELVKAMGMTGISKS